MKGVILSFHAELNYPAYSLSPLPNFLPLDGDPLPWEESPNPLRLRAAALWYDSFVK